MVTFDIEFTLTIKQHHPEIVHKLEFGRRLDDKYWWDPLPQIGSTILIPFTKLGSFGTSYVDTCFKMPCKVTDIIHELNGQFSYSKTTVCCEATCDLLYIMERFTGDLDLEVFKTLLKDRGWSVYS